MAYNKADFQKEADVSRETIADFDLWHQLLLKWNARINLVSKTALAEFWERHALDSWQICKYLPKAATKFLDLGSGAGFPGLAIAIALKQETPKGQLVLVESAGKKASFLRTVIRDLSLPAKVTTERAEEMTPEVFDVISARAFAPLPRLLTYAHPFWGQQTIGVFLKGDGVEDELTKAREYWKFDVESHQSRTDPTGKLIIISNLQPKTS